MEVMLKGPVVVKEGRGVGDEEGGDTKKVYTMIASDRSSMESSPRPSSSTPKDTLAISQEDQLESTKAEIGEVREENERLKTILARIVRDYQSLQTQFFDILQQEQPIKPLETSPINSHGVEEEPHELVSLSLGTSVSGQKEEKINTSKSREDDGMEEGLALGLDSKYEGPRSGANEPRSHLSPENSFEEAKEDEAGESWPPSKILKTARNDDVKVLQQITHVKKARVSVRARCDAPTMNDGCQWRKYGQKIAKGNPCPRAYYRCTVAPACPVRKQVQRCAEDMSILITTYEGNHNHPLPISATAMASTTSAAASMLISGSSAPRPANGSPASSSTPAAAISATNPNLNSFSFGLPDNMRARQFFLPNPRISSSPSHPTITLDLTAPPSTSQPSQFNRLSSTYSSTGFSLSSSESDTTPPSWSNGYLSYGTPPYNQGHVGSSSLGRQPQDPLHQSFLQKATNPAPAAPTQHPLTDTIAKAITSDPSFQSALTAAIASYVGAQGIQGGGEGLVHSLKRGEHFNSVAPSGTGCASSYLTRATSSSSNPRQGKLMFLQPPLPFSTSKSVSASPVENRENIN